MLYLSLYYANPEFATRTDYTGLIEINEVIDAGNRQPRLLQVIFWDRYERGEHVIEPGWYCRGWKMLSNCSGWTEYERGGVWVYWDDGDGKCGVYSRNKLLVTRTYTDREVDDRLFLDEHKRRKIFGK